MWQIQTYNHNTRNWEAFGTASADFHRLYTKVEELQRNGHKARLFKIPQQTEAKG